MRSKKERIVITTKIDEKLYKELKKIAVEEETTIIELIEKAIKKLLEEKEKEKKIA